MSLSVHVPTNVSENVLEAKALNNSASFNSARLIFILKSFKQRKLIS